MHRTSKATEFYRFSSEIISEASVDHVTYIIAAGFNREEATRHAEQAIRSIQSAMKPM